MAAKREQDFFWEGVDRGELIAQKCTSCSTVRHPPLPRCATCGSTEWEQYLLSGRGKILSWVWLAHPSGQDPNSRVGILVELEEGIRMVSNLVDTENVAIGAVVNVEFGVIDEKRLALFRTIPRPA